MVRILFTYIAPFLAPVLTYAAWVWYRTHYVQTHGGEAPKFEKGPWPMLMFAGALLTLVVLGVSAVLQGNSPDEGVYVPPRVENGTVVPGHIEPCTKPVP